MSPPAQWQLAAFMSAYPSMKVRPSPVTYLRLEGNFRFTASPSNHEEISEVFRLEICVSKRFPYEPPIVKEIGGRLPDPKHPDREKFHVNEDTSLCLGSPLRLKMDLQKNPTLPGFAELSLVPYLYAVSLKLKNGGDMVFGELAHGGAGLFDDYAEILGLAEKHSVVHAFQLLSLNKRDANKHPCPCGCGKRLGRCNLRYKMHELRQIASRAWYRQHGSEMRGRL